jgi:hypothetical protein
VDIKKISYESNEEFWPGAGYGLQTSAVQRLATKRRGCRDCLVLNWGKRLPTAAQDLAFARRGLNAAFPLPILHLLPCFHVRLNVIRWHIVCASD